MGTICRSPVAAAVCRYKAEQKGLATEIEFDSAGTHGHYHSGEPPDPRARRAAAARGYDLARMRARPVREADFDRFDRILAMDKANLAGLRSQSTPDKQAKLGLFLEYAAQPGVCEIPDPYYGDESGFERVIDLCELAAEGLLAAYARGALARPLA